MGLLLFCRLLGRSSLFLGLFLLSSSPVVQVMSYIMAVAAFLELRHDACRMLLAVAVLALGNHLVLCLVTKCTGKVFMLSLAGCEYVKCPFMAACTELRRHIIICNRFRRVSHMTFFAVRSHHIRRVRLMAFQTLRNIRVLGAVARGAEEHGMLCLHLPELLYLLGMAGQAWVGNIRADLDVQRCMRVGMAQQTVLQLEMRLAGMAVTAFGDDALCRNRRWMAYVAVLARDHLVFAAVGSYICRRLYVALDAVITAECRLRCRVGLRIRGSGKNDCSAEHQGEKDKTGMK